MTSNHVDVLIVGAGLSGIGAALPPAARTARARPSRSSRRARRSGGTWDLFRYPGIRSDSDMFTLGYSFRPWLEAKAIADGPSILDYIRDTAREHGIDRARSASTTASPRASGRATDARVDGRRRAHRHRRRPSSSPANFLLGCTGYYRYDEGFTPEFPGRERFTGEIIHPQHWPEDLDYAGKRVVVIGSGATAVTLVPAMAETAAHVTMLQRSPTYIVSLPGGGPDRQGRCASALPTKRAYSVIRWKNVLHDAGELRSSASASRSSCGRSSARASSCHAAEGLRRREALHADLRARGTSACASSPTATCSRPCAAARRRSSPTASRRSPRPASSCESGETLEADIVITATGLNLQAVGGIDARRRRRAGRPRRDASATRA